MSDNPEKPGLLGDAYIKAITRRPPDFAAAIRHLAAAQLDCALAVMSLRVALNGSDIEGSAEDKKFLDDGFRSAVAAYDRTKEALKAIGDE